MKRLLYILFSLVLTGVSCQREEFERTDVAVPEGYMSLTMDFMVSDMEKVTTKAVDPDGGGVQNIILYCFDAYGLFISTTTLMGEDHTPDLGNPSLSGTFKATVPDHTAVVHIVGNQNLTGFLEDDYRNRSEYEVMSNLAASAGRMIYWARHTVEELKERQLNSEKVYLYRNQAKITVESQDPRFVVDGFIVTNTSAFGTVAPYNHVTGMFEVPHSDSPFVTIPENDTKLGDFQDVRGNREEYVFETENTIEDPVNIIVKGSYDGGASKYYRVILMDDNGDQMMVLRNYHYKLVISDKLSYGQNTFAEALVAAATNNVWITVDDDVSEIHGLEHILSVDETSVVIDSSEFRTPNLRALYYTVERVDGAPLTEADKPQVTWMEGNNVAYNGFIHDFNTSTGRGIITVTLHSMGGLGKREGVLMVKIGRLFRKIKVTTIKKQHFTPAWASTQVYGYETGEHLTLMFTVPEECPEELFPLEVLISTNILDIRHEAGQELPIRFADDPWGRFYGEPNEWGYKYVYTVTKPGKQRLYLENILVQDDEQTSLIRVEAEHFDMLQKNFTFAKKPVNRAIIIHGLQSFSATMPADDPILYYLVPQKINARVEFSTHVGELHDDPVSGPDGTYLSGGENKYVKYLEAGTDDEFLFYSRYLSHEDNPHDCDFDFYPINENLWGTGGRVYGYTKNDGYSGENYGAAFHMITNASRSEEVVRIASNPKDEPSVTGVGVCTGQQYRSIIFELGNYHPFSFAAQIDYGGSGMTGTVGTGDAEETVDNLVWSFVPDKTVNIAFDLTSFKGTDGKSVDPFGTSFEVYIDAPMLELGDVSGFAGKVRKDPAVPGRFIYTVEADRESERAFGSSEPLLVDQTGLADQTGERKIIPFKVKDIVSAGDITISSQEDVVVFYKKSFKVQNESIKGRLQYQNGSLSDVPAEAFVVLERIKTFNRIGTVTVSDLSDGMNMDIRLRGEYTYSWYNDPVKIQYARTDGSETMVYEKIFDSLEALYAAASTGPIVLSHQ